MCHLQRAFIFAIAYSGNLKISAQFENQGLECKAKNYISKSCILLVGTDVRKISYVAFGSSSITIHYSVYRIMNVYRIMKCLQNNEVYIFFNKL